MGKTDFKYYEKIKVGSKYRYFYSKDEYDAYMDNQKEDSSPFKAISNFFEKFGKKAISDIKSKANDGKSFLDKLFGKLEKKKEEVKKLSAEEIENVYVAKSNAKHKSKYLYKEKLPNGKSRYFYSEKEHQTYLDKLQYQKDSPSFMSKFKRTKDLTDRDAPVLNEAEDTEQVNEKYTDGTGYEQNCMLATTAYELRRRGYDVEAQPNEEGYSADYLKKWYEKPKNVTLGGPVLLTLFDKGSRFAKPSAVDNITKEILKNNPPGSRGNIMVQWKGLNSGHSMIYEVDASNKVIIRDAQVGAYRKKWKENTPQLAELLPTVKQMSYTRTDNLKLKPGILEAFNDN